MPSHSGDSMLSDLSQFGDVYDGLRLRNSKLQHFGNIVPTKCYFRKLWLAYNALNIRKY
ncbi:hypothetical protein [Nostoc sp.]|uniref:hypothetical protein n=1 Tax=Nostoc sp. TaxID=1180 RepID=UPI002FF4F477